MVLFNGKAGCVSCRSGPFQTDHSFHAIAMPQVGPGKCDGPDGHDDYGREQVTGDPADRYAFRTPTLRNVALTAPYGHCGAYSSLEAVVRHHLDPEFSLYMYDSDPPRMPARADLDAEDFTVMNDPDSLAEIAAANELRSARLKPGEFEYLIAFLHALTDPAALNLRNDVPARVPSNLSLSD